MNRLFEKKNKEVPFVLGDGNRLKHPVEFIAAKFSVSQTMYK